MEEKKKFHEKQGDVYNYKQDNIHKGIPKQKDVKRGMIKETMQIRDKNFTFFENTSPNFSESPTKAVTGYFLFCNEEKVRLKEGMRALPRVLKSRWDGLALEERARSESLALENQERANMRKRYLMVKRDQRKKLRRV